jgi:hypothetical protein
MQRWFSFKGKIFTSKDKPTTYEEAKEKSTIKWSLISDGYSPDDDIETCGFCNLYIDIDCEGCPISEATGCKYCEETPFMSWIIIKSPEDAQKELSFIVTVA